MKNELQELFQFAAKYFIKQYKEKGGAQSILANELGITQSYLSSVTNGSRTASLELYSQIAEKLHGPLDKFLTVGRRIKEGREPLGAKEKTHDDPIENLIARLTYYVVDHQRIEKELSALKDFYETIVEKQPAGILAMDKDHNVTYVNKSMELMSKIPITEVIGTNLFGVEKTMPGLDIHEFKVRYQEAFTELKPTSYKNIRIEIPQGESVFNSGSFYPLIQEGEFNGMICTIYDTTMSHILKNLLVQTLNQSSHAIGIVQQTTPKNLPRIYYLNKKFKEIFGLKKDTAPSILPFPELHQKVAGKMKNGKQWLDFIQTTITSDLTDVRFTITMKNNKQYEWVSNPLIDDDGVLWGRIATMEEIPQKKSRKKK